MQWGTPMFGNVTALEGLHVIREIHTRTGLQELQRYLARKKQPPPGTLQKHTPGVIWWS